MPALSDTARAAGFQLVHLDAVGSTNAEALASGATGETRPTWFVADRQTAGRGRRGRAWVGLDGNLFATLLLTDPAPAPRIPELCFVAALALDDALLKLAPDLEIRFKVKWPNDALLDGAKVSGTLIEATTRGAVTQAAIGIGVNIAGHPDGMPYPTTSLQAAGFAVTRDQVFEALSKSMVTALAIWNRGQGFDAIRAGWLARAHNLGRPVAVRIDGRHVEGIFVGLDGQGRLLLDTPDGRETIMVGEVMPSLAGMVH
ncbi:biotin--[acetyl-CoA-carboxylase] ligase [Phreatobacter sp.]|uniref:biotin--[acetyl-CoA-carboxylase] ligase n=1 Tax=Phreatobacter sp. TaxID=1966341 RepID=UPI003F6FD9F3